VGLVLENLLPREVIIPFGFEQDLLVTLLPLYLCKDEMKQQCEGP
jgi:hypothetical protein